MFNKVKKVQLVLSNIIISLLIFCTLSCATTKQTVNTQGLLYDIQRIQMDMEYSALKELYDPEPFEQIKADLADGTIDRKECIYRLQEIICGYHVVHLRLTTTQDNQDFTANILPFIFKCFGEDIHIVIAAKQYEQYLGARVLEIGGVSMEEVLQRLSKYIVYETPCSIKYYLESTISYDILNRLGLTEKNGKIKIKLQKADSTIESFTCKPVYISKTKLSYLFPQKENPVLTVKDRNVDYGVKASKENGTVYAHFNRVWCNTEYRPINFFEDLMAELDSASYNTIVFDLRLNGGGSPEIVTLLSHLLYDNKETFEKYNLAIITTGRTYSAACWFLNEFLRIFPKAIVFGEETGQAIFNYTDVPYSNMLKYLQCNFAFPNQIDDHVETLYKRAKEVTHSDIHRGTMPDVEAWEVFEDWLNGQDTIYKAIDNYFN